MSLANDKLNHGIKQIIYNRWTNDFPFLHDLLQQESVYN